MYETNHKQIFDFDNRFNYWKRNDRSYCLALTDKDQTAKIAKYQSERMQSAQDGDLPFEKGEGYNKVRHILKAVGWKAARSQEGDENCASGTKMCDLYPKLESGPAAGEGQAIFRWKRNDRILIYTAGDPPTFLQYEYKNPAKNSKTANLIGSYVYHGKQGETFYEFVLTLKDKNIVLYKSDYTSGAVKNSGIWSFDEKKNPVTVRIKIEPAEESVMKFKAIDGNLEVVKKSENTDPIYGKGTIFKRFW